MSIYLPSHCRDDVINYSTWKSTHGIARVDCDNNRKEDNDDNDVDIGSNKCFQST